MATKQREYLTVREAAESLGVSGGRVRQFLLEGRLDGQKFGISWMIEREEVERFKQIDRDPGNPNFGK